MHGSTQGAGGQPWDADAERALIGSLYVLPAAWDAPECQRLRPMHYGDPAHQAIHGAMLALRTAGQPIEPHALAHYLRQAGTLDTVVGGLGYLTECLAAGGTGSSARTYADAIADHYRRRIIRSVAARVRSPTAP